MEYTSQNTASFVKLDTCKLAFVTNFVSCHEVGIGIERLTGQYQYQYLEGVKFQYQYQYQYLKVADGQYQYQYQYLENRDFNTNTNTNTGPNTNTSIPIPGIAGLCSEVSCGPWNVKVGCQVAYLDLKHFARAHVRHRFSNGLFLFPRSALYT